MNSKLRQQVLRNSLASMSLRAAEKELGAEIKFRATQNFSEWDPNENTISIGSRKLSPLLCYLNGGDWTGRLVYHELGHAVLDTLYEKMDQATFRRIFGGNPMRDYPDTPSIQALWGTLTGRVGSTSYAKSHAHGAWAEAFSYVVANVEDHDLGHDQIQQLAYVDWVLDNIKKKKKRWGKFYGYTQDVECDECGCTFVLEGCRGDGDIEDWEFDCTVCGEELIGKK